jgi:cyclophilin family peptidyl-prolyl cis-trans isomerase
MGSRNHCHHVAASALAGLVALTLVGGQMARAQEEAPAAEEAVAETVLENPRILLEIRGLHYDAGDAVRVRVSARNDGDEVVDNPLRDPVAGGFTVTDGGGKTHEPKETGQPRPKERPDRLPAGGFFGTVIDVARHFPVLAEPGRYTLVYGSGEIESNSVELNVIPQYEPDSTHTAVIKTAFGEMTLEFFAEDAPLTVKNFVDLARQGFYDGLTFHYVRPGDMIMGGDPAGDGTGGSGFSLRGEFNRHKHLAGTVGMVRAADPNSASSQFYICLIPQPDRDGRFTAFAQVVEGMDVLNRLAEVPTTGRNTRPFFRPIEPLVIDSITIHEEPPAQAGS